MPQNKYIDYTRIELCDALGLSYQTIWNREKNLGILNKRYSDPRVDQIINYKKKKKVAKNNKNKISIINFFINNFENSAKIIAKKMSLNEQYVNKVINEWLNNDKCILVDSKINN